MPDHNINGVKLEVIDGDKFALTCPCGWRTDTREHVKDAVAEWQRHCASVLSSSAQFAAAAPDRELCT